ncbi:MAG: protein kinase domain-containing protein, partial [Acidimicrobiales bacterium]
MPTPTPPSGSPSTGPTNPAGVETGRLLAGRYRLEHRLASGGMAQVWQGTDEVLRRKVAVKLLHPHLAADSTFVARFRQEAVAAARLAHPGIVSIYDTCSEDGTEAIVMELVVGRTLRERLDEPEPIDPWQAAGLAAQVAEALEAAHRAGLVHRDIKPANVLLSGEGRVKVADFGIAKAVEDADLTQPGLMVGTAKYLAPEQVEGSPVDGRTDLYSLGVVLYEMLCGRPPFEGESDAATALARLQRDPLRPRQVRPSVPKGLEEVVLRAMARAPGDRHPTAADLRAALLAAGAPQAPEADLTAADLTMAGATGLAPAPTSRS